MIRRRRNVSRNGLEFISIWEGEVLHGYNDSAGHCTIGIGHLLHLGNCSGAELRRTITHGQALDLLKKDARVAVKAVRKLVKRRLAQHEFDALVSFAFNVGTGALAESTLLRRVNDRASAHEIHEAFGMWTKAGGVVSQGLINRRAAEAALFNRKDYR